MDQVQNSDQNARPAAPQPGQSPRTRVLESATPVSLTEAPTGKLEPLAGAGVLLTKIVLAILSGVLLLLIATLIYQEKQFSDLTSEVMRSAIAGSVVASRAGAAPLESAEQLKARQELMKTYLDAANTTREFWAKIAQMVLLNLLLPVLTALLGYVFASKPAGK
jgi:hypothetical protein